MLRSARIATSHERRLFVAPAPTQVDFRLALEGGLCAKVVQPALPHPATKAGAEAARTPAPPPPSAQEEVLLSLRLAPPAGRRVASAAGAADAAAEAPGSSFLPRAIFGWGAAARAEARPAVGLHLALFAERPR